MSKRLMTDPIPKIKSAGIGSLCDKESAADSIGGHYQPPSTPEHLKKYRKTFTEVPGSRHVHHGLVGQKLPDEKHIYGVKTHVSDHV